MNTQSKSIDKEVFTLTQDGETLVFEGNSTSCMNDYVSSKEPDETETFFDWCKNSYPFVKVDKEVLNCPVCGSEKIRKDYDYPETMRCCENCGSDFNIDEEITLNGRTFDRPADKEVLEITGAMVEDGFSQPLSFDIAKAYNETYGKGYNPAAMDEVVKAAVNVLNWHKAHDSISFLEDQAKNELETALNNAKL